MTIFSFPLLYNVTAGGDSIVIYVDVLFIINFFITFLLLEVTARLTKRGAKTARLVLASAAGGAYSLIILADKLPAAVSFLSKLTAAVVMLLIAFKFYRLKSFFITLVVFLFANFLFLGIIIGLYFIFRSELIAVNNSVVYFDIGARGLLGCAFIAYLLSCLIVRLYNRRVSSNEIYTITAVKNGKSITLFAFADTGNRLREPFSNAPVIVAEGNRVSEFSADFEKRLIPASTVSGRAFLEAFKPDELTIKTAKGEEKIDNVYIALWEDMKNEAYSAVFNPEILSL